MLKKNSKHTIANTLMLALPWLFVSQAHGVCTATALGTDTAGPNRFLSSVGGGMTTTSVITLRVAPPADSQANTAIGATLPDYHPGGGSVPADNVTLRGTSVATNELKYRQIINDVFVTSNVTYNWGYTTFSVEKSLTDLSCISASCGTQQIDADQLSWVADAAGGQNYSELPSGTFSNAWQLVSEDTVQPDAASNDNADYTSTGVLLYYANTEILPPGTYQGQLNYRATLQ